MDENEGRKSESWNQKRYIAADVAVWLQQFRHWLRLIDAKLKEQGTRDKEECCTARLLQMKLLEHQVFQKEIQCDGAVLVATIRKYVNSTSGREENALRCKVACLEHRWHDLWLRSLERQCRLELRLRSIHSLVASSKSSSESPEQSEPIAKRPRLDWTQLEADSRRSEADRRHEESPESDTIPFPDEEYESIMDRSHLMDDNGNFVERSGNEEHVESGGPSGHVESGGPSGHVESGGPSGHVESGGAIGYEEGSKSGPDEHVENERLNGSVDSDGPGGQKNDDTNDPITEDTEVADDDTKDPITEDTEVADDDTNDPITEDTEVADQSFDDSIEDFNRSAVESVEDRQNFQNFANSPLVYYKTVPLDTDGATDTDTPRLLSGRGSLVPVRRAVSEQPGGHKSQTHHLEKSQSCMIDPDPIESIPAVHQFEYCNDFNDILGIVDSGHVDTTSGTSWSLFGATARRFSTPKQTNKLDSDYYPSCDASSEMSMDEAQGKEKEWTTREKEWSSREKEWSSKEKDWFSSSRTLLYGMDDQEVPVVNSLRRRRKRQMERFSNGNKDLPASASETAIMGWSFSSAATMSPSRKVSSNTGRDPSWLMTSSMSSSGYGGGGTGNESCPSGWRRKKLRARRMPRSMSDGEHLSFFNRRYRYPSTGVVDAQNREEAVFENEELVPPVPRGTPTLASNDDERSECNETDGDSVLLALERGGCGETMAALDEVLDDGERTAGDGGSTVSGADMSEAAAWLWDDYEPREHNENGPADQPPLDDTTLTTFGEDYRACLEQMSDSCNSAGPGSARMNGQKNENALQTFALSRPSPLGISHDSDSELEQNFQLVKESQRQLRSAQNTLKQYRSSVKPERNPPTTGLLSLIPTCQKNIKFLDTIVGNSQKRSSTGPRNLSTKDSNHAVLKNLLKDWGSVLRTIRQYIDEAPQMEGEEGNSAAKNEDIAQNSLKNELCRLRASLNEMLNQEGLSSARRADELYRSIDELQEDIDFIQTLRRRLIADANSYEKVSNCLGSTSEEISQLRSWIEEACLKFDIQRRQLESLRQRWKQWDQEEVLCRQLISDLGSKLRQPQHVTGPFDHLEGLSNSLYVMPLKTSLVLLERGVGRLEQLLNEIASSGFRCLSPISTRSVDDSTLSSLQDRTASLRREVTCLRNKIEQLEKDADAVQSDAVDNRNDVHKNKHRGKTTGRLLERGGRVPVRCWFWPIPLCLVIVLLLDVFFFYPACCEHVNRYWWSVGPKIHYWYGPPPT